MIRRRKAIGLAILATSLLVGGLAVAVALSAPGSRAGDPRAVEASLGTTLATAPPTTVPARSTDATTTVASPLWQPNRPVPLGAVTEGTEVPTRVRIEAIGVDAPIKAVGVDRRTGEMELPATVKEVAWYRFGPSPGEAGSAVLAAHVDFRDQGPGVFFDLKSLEPGDSIEVSFDDGANRSFQVAARDIYKKDELPLDVIFAREGTPVLTLVTCGGSFNPSIGHYDSNVVVYAVPVGPDDLGAARG